MNPWLDVDPDVTLAQTPRGALYTDPAAWEAIRERVFPRTWHLVAHRDDLPEGVGAHPFSLLPGVLDEPLVLTRDAQGVLRCLSNVCTHRANLVATEAGATEHLRCRYHGRRFGLDGSFQHMPEFEGCQGFPAASDDLPAAAVAEWGPFVLAGLDPTTPAAELLAPVRERLGWVPWDELRFDPVTSRVYQVQAHWALYVENYLEGFHVPYVHPGLAKTLDYRAYCHETFAGGSLQLGVAKEGEPAFDWEALGLPAEHPDRGLRVAGYYYWLFPATMLNLYPWGLSINVVTPLTADRTRVTFLSYVWKPELRSDGAGGELEQVELEDERVVEQVQRGVRSRLYQRGRYSPSREVCVHHFHRLLAAALEQE
jgi:phenylpropionate dioxygenase-like ring-hydroxylating dioxygenase large terminal subunit